MSLLSHVQSFQIQAPSGRLVAGLPIDLVAAPTEILDIPDTEVVTGPVDLDVVLKHVQLPAEAGVTPWPPPAVASVLANVTAGLAAAPGTGAIEGWLASISGAVPVGTRDLGGQIRIDLSWRFTDPATGAPLGDVAVIGGALDASALTIVLPPVVTEMTVPDLGEALTAAPVTRRLGVQVVVRGRVGTTQDTGDVLIPAAPLELEIIPLPLPSVAALFRDQELSGDAILLMVPAGSPFSGAAAFVPVLSALKGVVDRIDTAASLAAWVTGTRGLKSAVDGLLDRLPLTKHMGFQARDSFNNIGKYNFIERFGPNTDMEDRGSSALIISASRDIHFFQHDDFEGRRLALEPVPFGLTRFGGVVVRRLHVAVPSSEPPGCAPITGTPGGGTWGDVISSSRWVGGGVG
ncbi:MAG: hypothetical protein ACRD2T_16075 [Thermoanaerobaculia bacterium]